MNPLVGLDIPEGIDTLDFSRVLFLDFDGVLHPEVGMPDRHFCCLPDFSEVLRAVDPGLRLPIVISSMWRIFYPLQTMRERFPPDIAGRIVGVTPSSFLEQMQSAPGGTLVAGERPDDQHREGEVRAWMRVHAPGGQWLAVDDREGYFSPGCPHLFAVPRTHQPDEGGITAQVAADLRVRLQEFLRGR